MVFILAALEHKMARRQAIPGEQSQQALLGAPQLRSFIIPNVKLTGRQLDGGSYGTVEIDGLVCAGKKLYDAFIDPKNQGTQHMVDKYYNECRLLSDLRYPHIVQFLGICFLPDSRLPVLVMDSLHELLRTQPTSLCPYRLPSFRMWPEVWYICTIAVHLSSTETSLPGTSS